MLEAIIITAFELCTPGASQFECQQWMQDCMSQEIGYRELDHAAEVCIEQLPQELWPY